MIKKILLNRKHVFFFIFNLLFICFLFLLLKNNYFNNGNYIVGGDNSWLINPNYINRLFVWNGNINTGYFYPVNDIFPIGIFYSIFKLFNLKNNYQIFYYFSFYFLSFFSINFLIRKIFIKSNNLISLIASFMYVFNSYNLTSPFNDRLFPIFIILPILFYFYYKLVNVGGFKNIIFILLCSIMLVGPSYNPATVFFVYLILLLYLIFFLTTEKINKKIILLLIKNHVILFLFFLLVNLWWLVMLVPSMLEISFIGEKINSFRATGTGFLYDHFRLIGNWAWYSASYLSKYYPYNDNYYNIFLLIVTFFLSIFSLSLILFLKNNKYFNHKDKRIYLFFFTLFVIGIFLSNGTKHFMGKLFEVIYDSNKLFWIFREPWAKFGPIMVFSLPILFYGSFNYVENVMQNKKRFYLLFISISILIIISVFPFLTGDVVWKKWNGAMRTNLVEIPKYYDDIRTFLDRNKLENQKILVFPYNFVYMAFNWKNGFFVSSNPATLLLKNHTIVSSSLPMYSSDIIINNIFDNLDNNNFNLKNYLSLLNTKYILQENDADWRYSGNKTLPPIISNFIIKKNGFKEVSTFGKFTKEYLLTIPNDEPNKSLKNILYAELNNQPALILYKNNNYLQQFYTPKYRISSSQDIRTLSNIVSEKDYATRSAIFFNNIISNQTKLVVKFNPKALKKEEIKNTPILEFKKINPTKYRVVVHGAKGEFPLIFSESFHDGWKSYLASFNPQNDNNGNLLNYKILDGNVEGQASGQELKSFIDKGWITTLGDDTEKEIKHMKWKDNNETLDYVEKYNVNFISKNFQDTIQNDNLSNGSIFETWFKKPIDDNKNHLVVNGYANSWNIDVNKLCTNNSICKKNPDGSYDFEIVVEFWPQRLFYIGLFISGTTLVCCLLYLALSNRARN